MFPEYQRAVELFATQHAEVKGRYPDLSGRRLIHEIIRRMINLQIIDLVESSQTLLTDLAPQHINDIRAQHAPLIRFSAEMQQANQSLKRFLRENLYNHYRVHRMTSKAQRTLKSLFDAFMQEPRMLNPEYQAHIKQLETEYGESGRARAVADYIAGMTDRYAISEYQRIFEPETRT